MKTDNVFEKTYLKLMGLINEDAEVDAAEEVVAGADEGDTADGEEKVIKKVCFTTSDENLIEALQNGIAKAIFTIAKEGEDGEETEEKVEFGGDAFGEFTVTEVCPVCGEDPCVCDEDDPEMDDGDVDDDVTESVKEEETEEIETDSEDGEVDAEETDEEVEEN